MPSKTIKGKFYANALHEYPVPAKPLRPLAKEIKPKDRIVIHPYDIIHNAYDEAHDFDVASTYIAQGISRNGLKPEQLKSLQKAYDRLRSSIFVKLCNPRMFFALEKLQKKSFQEALTPKERRNVELIKIAHDDDLASGSWHLHDSISSASKKAYKAWEQACEEKSVTNLIPAAGRHFRLVVEHAVYVAKKQGGMPYDYMLRQYDRDFSLEELSSISQKVLGPIKDGISEIESMQLKQGEGIPIPQPIPVNKQLDLAKRIFKFLGLEEPSVQIQCGYQPLMEQLHHYYTQVTLEAKPEHPLRIVEYALHEAGHVLYFLNLPKKQARYINQPVSRQVGTVIDETVAIYFQTMLLKSPGFLKFLSNTIKEIYEVSGPEVSWQNLFLHFNKVKTQNTRLDTNNSSILLRTAACAKTEFDLMSGNYSFSEYPHLFAQNTKGIVPTDSTDFTDSILTCYSHWIGDWGYEPMYPPAFLLAVQFDKAIQNEITGLDKQLEKGDSSKVVDWWRRNVFNHGSRYTSHELIQSSTGSLPNPDLYIPFHKSLTEGVRKIAAQTINPK